MIGKIFYILLLGLTVYLNIMYEWSVGTLVLASELLLGLGGILWALWQRRNVDVVCDPGRAVISVGEKVELHIKMKNKSWLPVSKCKVIVRYFYDRDSEKEKLCIYREIDAKEEVEETIAISPRYCGKLEVQLEKVCVFELMRLFSFSKKDTGSKTVTVLPKLHEIPVEISEQTRMFPVDSEVYDPYRSGDDPSEVFEVREYRSGDRLQRVHWKLSAREESLMVKEYSRPVGAAVVLMIENSGELRTQKEKSHFFEMVFSASHSLLDEHCAHYVTWIEEGGYGLQRMRVESEESFYDFMTGFLAADIGRLVSGIEGFYGEWFGNGTYHTAVTINETSQLEETGLSV